MFFLVKKKKKKKKVKIRLKKRLREESNKEETELGGWTTEAGSLLVGRKPGGWEEGWDKMHGSQKHQIPCVHCAGRVCILLLRVPPASPTSRRHTGNQGNHTRNADLVPSVHSSLP